MNSLNIIWVLLLLSCFAVPGNARKCDCTMRLMYVQRLED